MCPSDTKLWMIPIEIISLGSTPQSVFTHLLSAKEDTIFIEGIKPTDCIKLNPGSSGFYRVHYSAEMLQVLQSAVLNGSLAPSDRLGLLDDLFALVSKSFVGDSKYLSNIVSFFIFCLLSGSFSPLNSLGSSRALSKCSGFRTFVRDEK